MSYALIAHTAARSGDNSSVTTGSIDTTGADFIIAVVQTAVVGGTTNGSVTDNKSNTYNLIGQSANAGGTKPISWIFYSVPGTVGSGHTFSFNISSSFPAIAVCAFSGGLANQISGVSGTGITSYQVGSFNSTVIPGLAIATLGWIDSLTAAIDNGFTISDQLDHISSSLGIAMAYKIDPTGTINPTWSWSGSTTFSVGALVALFNKTGSGGSSGGSYAFS